eukprot:GHVU01196121.1.p1 GENE.GHVU01196121.1~~GHVU01196121.1.p1  ORF type:complete len:183 (-),score=11.90 GHVU01196121.1:21-569(-)
MWSHDADPTTVVVKYMEGHSRWGKATVSHKEADIKMLDFYFQTKSTQGWPISGITATGVADALQQLVNSNSSIFNKFNWKDYTIAFQTINKSGNEEKVWRTYGMDEVKLDTMLNAFIFKNTGPKFAACRNTECLINIYLNSFPAFVVAPRFMSVGETGSLQDRSSLCMPLCRTRFPPTMERA